MRFTRLRLNGFKSFVDPTDLVIAEGLTGVVGPNGCGKSNLLEALRWVMGENRASAMRGGGMEDVIFAGTSSRPARNFAEVALTLDNAERLAPAGFNDSDALEVVRRITRDAGSAYKVNTRDVRARDVQMLFADASTGAHSPALVRQGQIVELISAKPKARRRILEEAAGISGLYQRRHEAELRLNATEANLARVEDVTEALAAQLQTLARQARQAARYRELGEALRRAEGMLLFRRWREAEVAQAQAAGAEAGCRRDAALAEAAARDAVAAREGAEAALPPLREEETIATAVLQRLIAERDMLQDQETRAHAAIDALRAQVTQILRDTEREAGLNRDAEETITQLEWETAQLAKAGEGHEARLAASADAAREAASTLAAREADLSAVTEDVARLAARHQSAHRALAEIRTTLEKAEGESLRARSAETAAAEALARAEEEVTAAEEAGATALDLSEAAEARLAEAEAARAAAQSAEAEARAARSGAEGEASALRAEWGALSRLVTRDADGGTQILDRLRVVPGYEQALGAALADDLRAPEISDAGATGWALLPDYPAPQPLPAGAEPLAAWVEAPPVLARRLAQVGLVPPDHGAALQPDLKPGQRLVSAAGDLWRWDGFRSAAADAPSAAALRLQQLNRLAALERDLDQAEGRADAAREAHEAAQAHLAGAVRADQAARDDRRAADARLTEANRALSRAEADRSVAGGRLEAARLARSRHEDEAGEARLRLSEAAAAVEDLGDLDQARAGVEDLRTAVEAARMTMMTRRAAHDETRRDGEARVRRAQEVAKELATWRNRQETAARRGADLAARRAKAEADLTEAQERPLELAERREELGEAARGAEIRRDAAGAALAEAEAALRAALDAERETERRAGETREARARAEARLEAARETLALAAERIREETEEEPAALLARLGLDPDAMPPAEEIEAEIIRLRRSRDGLGAVNLRAEEDAREVQGEYDTLTTEKADLQEAVKKLRAGIAGLNREGRERLLAAFEQVNRNFAMLFTHLFGGGEARLVLVESEDPLDAGLEIMCQPPGKKLATLSLLSGGEQTLTAMALIFAVFLANPAPICVLDEVDAPLDDANVTRFCDLLDEMTRRTDTRFLIITHHAVTMARMDRLFGVTMVEQGVSQLVSVDLKKAEAMVA
ncbi:chromosome segregation SMC family protein [Halodurantibacterium flavum]|uniref:Chromosome partition protein Smc n=1 Tax=Halodurantibacterium flavum TaxID=1382802 RepID=A0ABW4S2E0_9RHOB